MCRQSVRENSLCPPPNLARRFLISWHRTNISCFTAYNESAAQSDIDLLPLLKKISQHSALHVADIIQYVFENLALFTNQQLVTS